MKNWADRNALADILGEISWYEHEKGNPLLSAIVVHADDDHKMPGKGFFDLAREAGCQKPDEDDVTFYARELGAVHECQNWD